MADADSDANIRPKIRVESYDGENEELDSLDALLSKTEEQPSLLDVLEGGPIVAGDDVVPQVAELYEMQLGPEDLQACLRQGERDRSLDVLTLMVLRGEAVAPGVDTDVDLLDINRAHPELVLLLRGQALSDLIGKGDAHQADAYYRNHIKKLYPDGTTGNQFVDKLLEIIKALTQGTALPSPHTGGDYFNDATKTRQSVNDYIRIYFPGFRHMEVEEGRAQVDLFGEKQDNGVRCLACHKVFKRYTTTHPSCGSTSSGTQPAGRRPVRPPAST